MRTLPRTDTASRKMTPTVQLMIIFILLNSFGFPGNYTRVFGSRIGMLIEYISFFFQLGIMFLLDAKDIMEIKLIDLKKKFWPVYMFLAVVFCISMLVTINKKEQAISCIRICTTGLFALWLSENLEIDDFLETAYYAQVLLILANLVFVTVFRRYVYRESASYARDFVGVYSAKNGAGTEFAFNLVMHALLFRIFREKKRLLPPLFFPVVFLELVLLALTHNVGAMLSAFVAIFYILSLQKRIELRIPLGYMYVVGSVGFLLFALTILPFFSPLLESLGKDATLTGRVPLWEQIIKVMQENRTLTGFGYGMFWRNDAAVTLIHAGFNRYSFMHGMVSGAHNVTLELWMNIGLIGIAALYFMILYSYRRIYEIQDNAYLLCTGYMIMFMIYGWTERAFGTYEYMTLFIFYTTGLANNREIRKERKVLRLRETPREARFDRIEGSGQRHE